ncbi:internal scaffolding protein [Microviridae sp.]|nr:internal scaffolding protein [Microviridae sp.]
MSGSKKIGKDSVRQPFLSSNARRKPLSKSFTNSLPITKQSFKDECDINRIMAKYQQTGVLEHVKYVSEDASSNYGNYLNSYDYHDAYNAVLRANEMFDTLPSSIRSKFENDPAKFLAFSQDPENDSEMKKLGLKQSIKNTSEEPISTGKKDEKKDVLEEGA